MARKFKGLGYRKNVYDESTFIHFDRPITVTVKQSVLLKGTGETVARSSVISGVAVIRHFHYHDFKNIVFYADEWLETELFIGNITEDSLIAVSYRYEVTDWNMEGGKNE